MENYKLNRNKQNYKTFKGTARKTRVFAFTQDYLTVHTGPIYLGQLKFQKGAKTCKKNGEFFLTTNYD